MYKVILAGGLASGKSTALEVLRKLGAQTCCLDDIAREVRNTPQIADRLAEEFGSDILDGQGRPIPAMLAARAFASPENVKAMDSICLPAIDVRSREYLQDDSGAAPMKVLEVPLLDRAQNLLELADESVAIVAPESSRAHRAVERGLDAEDVEQRMASQVPQDSIAGMVDTVIANDSTREEFERKIEEWWRSRTEGSVAR